MLKTRLYTALTGFVLAWSLVSVAAPRLTVVIAVDGLHADAMERLRPYWQAGGLSTLQEEAQQTSLLFPFDVQGGEETLATLLTGEIPARHGLWYPYMFMREDRRLHSFYEDTEADGIGIEEHLSLHNLSVPTLTDLFRLRHGQYAKLYAIGQQAPVTLLLAGHTADACCWQDPVTHQWVTTSYYPKGLPSAADEENISGRIEENCRTTWQIRMQPSSYLSPTEQERHRGFAYSVCDVLHNSPKVNSLTVDMVLRIVEQEHLGTDNMPDLLLMELTTQSPRAVTDRLESAEQEEMYTTLNEYLGFFLEQLQHRIGGENLQVFVFGIPRKGQSEATRTKIGLPVKPFNVDQAAALTSVYLMALYGHERWIDGIYGQSVFLNRPLIEQKGLDIQVVQRKVADFLMDFEGVQYAYPRNEALLIDAITNQFAKPYIGDVVFGLRPAWQLYEDEQTPMDYVTDTHVSTPLYWWRPNGNTLPTLPAAMQAQDLLPIIINQP